MISHSLELAYKVNEILMINSNINNKSKTISLLLFFLLCSFLQLSVQHIYAPGNLH